MISSQISQATALPSWRWTCSHHCPFSWAPSSACLSHTEFCTLRAKLLQHPAVGPCQLPEVPASPPTTPVPPGGSLYSGAAWGSGKNTRPGSSSNAEFSSRRRDIVLNQAPLLTCCVALGIFLLEQEVVSLWQGHPQAPARSSEVGQVTSLSKAGRVWFPIQIYPVCRINIGVFFISTRKDAHFHLS